MEDKVERIKEWSDSSPFSFEETLVEAMEQDYNGLRLLSSVNLTQTILIKKKNTNFTLIGGTTRLGEVKDPGEREEEKQTDRVIIEGTGHCLFQITGKKTKIAFHNLILSHKMSAPDKREIGGVIFAMGYSHIEMTGCNLYSSYGFGLWGVQNSQCRLTNCSITSQERSGCVFFGKSSLHLNSCQILSCGQHGICVRGQVNLVIEKCQITRCRVRGVYCYDKSKVVISNSEISQTQSPDHAALEIWGGISPLNNTIDDQCERCPAERRFKRNSISLSSQPLYVSLQCLLFYQNNGSPIRYRDNVQLVAQEVYYYHPYLKMCFPLKESHLPFFPSRHGLIVSADHAKNSQEDDSVGEMVLIPHVEDGMEGRGRPWEYLVNDEEWRGYSDDCSRQLTLKYTEWKQSNSMEDEEARDCRRLGDVEREENNFRLPEPYEHYTINFSRMEQVNERTHFTRRIRQREFIT